MCAMSTPAILFDLDGTLVDSRRDLTTAVNLVLAEYGVAPLSMDTVTSYVGNGSDTLMARALGDAEVSVSVATERLGFHYRQHLLDETVLYDGIIETLEELQGSGYKLAVVTNKTQASACRIVRGLGVDGFFETVLGDTGTCGLKPETDLILQALQVCDAVREGSWMLGDNYTDLAAGRRAGLQTCFCAYGFGARRGEPFDISIACPRDFPVHLAALQAGTMARG